VTCHGTEKSKGGYQLSGFELALKPGESKTPSINPGQPKESELYRRISTENEEDRMPQKEEPLTNAQIALITRWIAEGARFDGSDRNAPLITLIPKAPKPDPPAAYPLAVPIVALAFSPDGKELAAGGYYEITFWNPEDG